MAKKFSKPGYVTIDGQTVANAMNAKYSSNSNDKPVRLLVSGLSGFSDGSAEHTVELSSAIPVTGYEIKFHSIVNSHTDMRVGFHIGTESYELEGRWMSVDTSTDVDNPNAVNATFSGKLLSGPAVT